MQIIPVTTKQLLKQFILLPFTLYKNDPNWVAPMISDQMKFFDPEKNPYFEHSEVQLFLALKDGKVVGRISAHTNTQHNKFHEDKVGFFGFFECINDQEVANALLDTAKDWNRKHGMDTLRGPMNLSTNDECGLLIEGYDTPPYVMMTHNPPYYLELLEKAGFAKVMDLNAWYTDTPDVPERLIKLGKMIEKKQNFTIRTLNKKDLKRDIKTVFTIYQKAWERNWGFVPMTKKEFDHTVATLLPIVDTDLVFIAEVDGQPAGFSVALPDYNVILQKFRGKITPAGIFWLLYYTKFFPKKMERVRVITMGVVKEYQSRGIDIMFYYHSFLNGHKKGLYKAEYSWVLETNTMMNRIAVDLMARVHKKYRILGCPI